MTLEDCGTIGFAQENQSGSGVGPNEALTIRDLGIRGTGLFYPFSAAARAGLSLKGLHTDLLIERVTTSETTGPGITFGGSLAHATLRELSVDGVEPGWLGYFSESGAPACSASNQARWITTSNASGPSDCNLASGTGASRSRCICSSGSWVPMPVRVHAGIELIGGAQSSLDVQIEDSAVSNERADTGVRLVGSFSSTVVDGLTGSDTSFATDQDQRSAIVVPSPSSGVTLSNVQCIGTNPGVPCVEFAGP